MRLLDMGVPRYMVATSLQAVIAQRLVRVICESCAAGPRADAAGARSCIETEWTRRRRASFKRGRGCSHCNGTGYRGRIGVYEMLEMTPRAGRGAIAKDDVPGFMRAGAASRWPATPSCSTPPRWPPRAAPR